MSPLGVGATRIQYLGNANGPETPVLGWFGLGDDFYPAGINESLQLNGTVDDIYRRMTGRFIVLRYVGSSLTCIADAGAQFPVVYRPETQELASTPLLLGWTMPLEKSPLAAASFSRTDGTVWFPFGTTPYSGIKRLLPQQCLVVGGRGARLLEWRPVTPEPLQLAQMHCMTSRFIQALGNSLGELECHLTAGWDSRMVLSASWPIKNRIDYLTYLSAGITARVDNQVAKLIAGRFDLPHETYPVSTPSQNCREQWLERTSYCVHDSVTELTKTVVESYADRYGLSGVGGEVGRAFYWNKKDIGAVNITPELLLERLNFEKTRFAASPADHWLEYYRGQSRTRILDRAYIDIRLGCWAGPSLCGHLVEKPTLSPFDNYTIYESMLALPEVYRLSGAFARDFISQSSAELARIPVNRPLGISRLKNLPRELARKLPKSSKSYLRKYCLSLATRWGASDQLQQFPDRN